MRQQCSSFAFRCRMAECRLRSEEILPARQGHKRVDTCGFHPLVDHPFPLDSLAQIADM